MKIKSKLVNLSDRSDVRFVTTTVAMMLAYFVVQKITGRALDLHGDAYHQPFLLPQVFGNLGTTLAVIMAIGGIYLLINRGLIGAWDSLEEGRLLRWFVMALALVITWPLSTYGYNYYFDQSYGADRAFLVVCLLLSVWRPVFILPWLLTAYAMLGQLTEPSLGGSVLAHKTQVIKVLELFAAAFLVGAVTGRRTTRPYIYLSCCFVAAGYWLPALAKMQLDWLGTNRLDFIPLSAYGHGWLAQMQPGRLVAWSEFLRGLNGLMHIGVIVLEAAFLLFLLKRSLSFMLLILAIVFHLIVFALFGFFFWTWIALDMALLVLLYRYYRESSDSGWSKLQIVLSVGLIGFGAHWADPPALAWFETPLTYSYRVTAVMDDGAVEPVHPRFFAPYEDAFTMAGFSYLVSQHAVLVGPYGVTRNKTVKAGLIQAQSADDVFALEAAQKEIGYDPKRAEKFRQFLSQWISNRNRQGDKLTGLYQWHAPLQFWSQHPGIDKLAQRHIRELIVSEVTLFYDGRTLQTIREIELLRIEPSDAPM